MKLKITACLAILLTAAVLIAGCSAAKPKSANDSQMQKAVSTASKSYSGQAETTADSGGGQAIDTARKVIKDATVYLTARKADDAFTKISAWAGENGAIEFSRNSKTNGSNRTIYVVYKIDPDKLASFLDYIGTVGEVVNSDIKSSDITDQYYDAQARLGNLINTRDQLLEIQKKANNIDETLRVQKELSSVTSEIESLKGKISLWDKLTAESTLTLTISEESDPLKPAGSVSWKFSSFKDIGQTIKNGFTTTCNVIGNIFIWIVVVIASISPLLVGAAIVVAIVIFVRRAKKRKS